jgi:hypothetical protein
MLRLVEQASLASPDIALGNLEVLNRWHASVINEKLRTALSPKWRSPEQLYLEV